MSTGKSSWSFGELSRELFTSLLAHKVTEGGKGGHGHAEPGPVAKPIGRIFDVIADRFERGALLDEKRRRLIAKLKAGQRTHILALHKESMARTLRFVSGRTDILFGEDDFIELLGGYCFKVEVVEHTEREIKEPGGGKKPQVVHEHATKKTAVVERDAKELGGKTVDESLEMLDLLARDKREEFLQFLYGLKDDGLRQSLDGAANHVADELESAMDKLAGQKLFGPIGPRILRGWESPARAVPAPAALYADDLDEPLPPPPKQGWFESREEFFPRLERWTADRNVVAARNRERQRLRDERARNGGAS